MAKRGRPVRDRARRWVNDEGFVATVTSIIESRDKANEETLTNVVRDIEAFARATIPPAALTDGRFNILRRLAVNATPSVTCRTLLSWHLDLEDRVLLKVQQRHDTT
jgi:hypothetical protein